MKIKLEKDQTGYEVIDEYIRRFWKYNNNFSDTVICQIDSSYDGIKYEIRNEIATPSGFSNDIEFLYDWWEGEQYIKLIGICYLSEIEPYSGIYSENGVLIDCDTCVNRGKYGSCTLNTLITCSEYEEWKPIN